MQPSLNPWMDYWLSLYKFPLSGDVMQDITTKWLAPTLELNFAGNPQLEKSIIENVASYGKQLGILTKAILAIANKQNIKGPEIDKLEALDESIKTMKDLNAKSIQMRIDQLETSLQKIKQDYPAEFAKLLQRLK